MKAIIYCRVSSQRQVEEGHGLDGQERRCRDFAKMLGYQVAKVFRDEGVSGGIIERDGMQALLHYLDENNTQGEEKVVIIDDIKRLARDVQGHFTLKTAICSRNARLESPSHRFEDTPEGKFVETVLAGAAELERNQNKKQVVNRMKARLENGYWPFCNPKGLIFKKDPIHGKLLIPNEPKASIYKAAIEKFRDGILQRPEDVKNYIDAQYEISGLETVISLTAAKDLLREILYTGYIEYDHWEVSLRKGQHEGFISLETYNAVQERLAGRSKPWKRRDYNAKFPLKPLVLCAACHIPMTASMNTGRHGVKYPNYFCRRKGCIYNYKVTRKNVFEDKFESYLVTKKPADDILDLTKDVMREQWDIRLEQHTNQRFAIQNELQEATEEKRNYLKQIAHTKNDDLISDYEEEVKVLKAKEKELTQKLGKRQYTSEEFGTAVEKVFGVLKQPQVMWKSDDYNDKRTILLMYFDDQLQYDYKEGFGTASLAYPVNEISDLGQANNGKVEMSASDAESE